MIQFPITDLLSELECYSYLLHILHPDGLECPSGHVLPSGQAAQDRSRDPLLDYKCRVCCKVFNVFTGTGNPLRLPDHRPGHAWLRSGYPNPPSG